MGIYLKRLSKKNYFFRIVYIPFKLLYQVLCFLCGISLSLDTKVGGGLYIGHYGGIVIHPQVVIGENCNISQGITIGEGGRGEKRGVPKIGDHVYIGPGAVIFGNIEIGSHVAIGANAVVTKSVPDNAVVGGVPAGILNYKGSGDFVIV